LINDRRETFCSIIHEPHPCALLEKIWLNCMVAHLL
jgi:hypothetical protein